MECNFNYVHLFTEIKLEVSRKERSFQNNTPETLVFLLTIGIISVVLHRNLNWQSSSATWQSTNL